MNHNYISIIIILLQQKSELILKSHVPSSVQVSSSSALTIGTPGNVERIGGYVKGHGVAVTTTGEDIPSSFFSLGRRFETSSLQVPSAECFSSRGLPQVRRKCKVKLNQIQTMFKNTQQ